MRVAIIALTIGVLTAAAAPMRWRSRRLDKSPAA